MRILQIAGGELPIHQELRYAGIERNIFWLNQELAQSGEESFVAAASDSDLGNYGTLLATFPESLWRRVGAFRRITDSAYSAYQQHYRSCLEAAVAYNLDLLHDHSGTGNPEQGLLTSAVFRERKNGVTPPLLTTLHFTVRSKEEEKYQLWKRFQQEKKNIYFNAISHSQRKEFEHCGLAIEQTIYHGLPKTLFPYQPHSQDYLFWIGRICPNKGPDLAIALAKRVNLPLIIAGEIQLPDYEFYQSRIRPQLSTREPWMIFQTEPVTAAPQQNLTDRQQKTLEELLAALAEGQEIVQPGEVAFIGPLTDREKSLVFRNAYATLVPNRWKEPFGLVLIESLMSGTPVLGTALGSLPEIIRSGETGMLVPLVTKNGCSVQRQDQRQNGQNEQNEEQDSQQLIEEMAGALRELSQISNLRQNCRKDAEHRFTIERTVQEYRELYRKMMWEY